VRKTASFFEFSLCLSRACLGKIIVFVYKWLEKTVFHLKSLRCSSFANSDAGDDTDRAAGSDGTGGGLRRRAGAKAVASRRDSDEDTASDEDEDPSQNAPESKRDGADASDDDDGDGDEREKRKRRTDEEAAAEDDDGCGCLCLFLWCAKTISVRTLRFLWSCCVCPEPVLLNQANKSDRGFCSPQGGVRARLRGAGGALGRYSNFAHCACSPFRAQRHA
jgi:hypothetical protein